MKLVASHRKSSQVRGQTRHKHAQAKTCDDLRSRLIRALGLCYWNLKRTIEDTNHSDEHRLFFNEGQKVYYKVITWLFGKFGIKFPLCLGKICKRLSQIFPRLQGNLITNFLQVMLCHRIVIMCVTYPRNTDFSVAKALQVFFIWEQKVATYKLTDVSRRSMIYVAIVIFLHLYCEFGISFSL